MSTPTIPPYIIPISRFGKPASGELIEAKTFRTSVKFEAATFVVAKCRVLFAEGGKLFLFKKDGTTFCTVEGPTAGVADADGWILMPIVDFLGGDLAGGPIQFDDGNDFTCWGPDPADATGETLIFTCEGTKVVPT